MLDTSAQGGYRSIDEFSRARFGAGSILRGLHRYAADAFIVLTLGHLTREWVLEDQLRAALQALRGRRGAAQPHTAREVHA